MVGAPLMRAAERTTLGNGLRLLVSERPESRVVAIRAVLRAGQRVERRPGVASLCGAMLVAGAGARDEESLVEAVEATGGSVGASGNGVSLRFLARDAEFALGVLADLLRRPHFERAAFERERALAANEVAAERDHPMVVANRALAARIYGAHPYARNPRGDPSALEREDLLLYHAEFFTPDRTIVTVSGGIDAARIAEVAHRLFGDWGGGAGADDPLPATPPHPSPSEETIPHEGSQVHLVLGHLGVRRTDPDFDRLRVMEHILGTGSGFTDRLSRRLRDEWGLAYTVNAEICPSSGTEPGFFRAYVATSPRNAARARAEVVRAMREMRETLATAEEMQAVRNFLTAQVAFDLETAEGNAEVLAGIEHYGLDPDEPERFRRAVAAVTAEDVREASRRHLLPDRLAIVAVGPPPASLKDGAFAVS